jgi:large subunit ribosomal protein L30e
MTQAAIADIQKAILEHKELFGTRQIRKQIASGNVKHIYLTANCAKQVEEDVRYYAQLSEVTVEKLDLSNEDLSVLCKQPFLINVVSILQ